MHTDFRDKDVEITKQERRFEGFFKIDQMTFNHKRFDGGQINGVVREVLRRHDAVAVLPYDPVRDELLLIKQLRIATVGKTREPWMLELVAGLVDHAGEDLEDVARREAHEEAGLILDGLYPIYDFFNSAGGSNEKTALYLALCDLGQAGGYFGLEAECEDIYAFTIKRQLAMDLLKAGKIENASAIIGLLWLNAEYQRFLE